MTQVILADKLGISASYLNLIEHNRRTLTVQLLLSFSQILNIDPQIFSPKQDGRLASEVAEVLKDPLFKDLDFSDIDPSILVIDAPTLCSALTKSYNAWHSASNNLQVLSERVAQNPILSQSSYRLRTLLTSIMSFSEILHDNSDLEPAERKNFLKIVMNESESLSETVTEMLGFVSGDGMKDLTNHNTPNEAVSNFFQTRGNYFGEIEEAATELRKDIGIDGLNVYGRLSGYLLERHGVNIEIASKGAHDTEASIYDDARKHLTLSKALPSNALNFHLANLICQLSFSSLLEKITDSPDLTSDAAKHKTRIALANYFAGACLLPYDAFLGAAETTGYDVELIQQRFSASFEQVCHRLTTLRRPNQGGVPFHFIRVDVAGNISKHFSASGLRIPKFGSACPRWIVHNAFLMPATIQTQHCQLPDGKRFFSIAKTITKPSLGYQQQKTHYSVCIGCDINDAKRLIYAKGLDLSIPEQAVPVGTACRLCERDKCAQRAAPPPPQSATQPMLPGRNISPGVGDL